MRFYNGKEYYTVTETSEIIKENTSTIYYHIKNNPNFPEPTIIENLKHYAEEDIKKISEILETRREKRGVKKEKNYIPRQNNSYSRLRTEYAELLKENEKLKKEIEELEEVKQWK